MVLETAALFADSWLVDLGKQKLGEMLLQGMDQRLNPRELQQLLNRAVQQANEQVPELFMACELDGRKGAQRFFSLFLVVRAIEELQKPLKGEGKPDAELLRHLFWNDAKDHPIAPRLRQDYLLPWMQVFVDAYFESTTACLKIHHTLESYCQKLSSKLGKLVFDGMTVDGKVVNESGDLMKLFVMPEVRTYDSRWAKDIEAEQSETISNPQERILWEQRRQGEFLKQSEQADPFSAAELLQSKKRRVVLLGAAGAGKTTLINYLLITAARQCSQAMNRSSKPQVPMLIRIRDLSRQPELSILEFAEYCVKQELDIEELPANFFDYWLERGRVLILVDGLDEIPNAVERRKTVDKLELFLSHCPRCPVLITSRPAGYRNDYFSRDDYPHYELQPFHFGQIDQFINYWYENCIDLEGERRRRKANLRRALKDEPRIDRLAGTPLLLTLIVLIHRYRNLPKHRHELYNSAVETLISLWDKSKELTDFTANRTLKYLELGDIRRLMEKLAYWIHAQGSMGEAEDGTQIERDMLIRQLGKMITEIKAPQPVQLHLAEKDAEFFLDEIIRDQAGLLSLQGQNRYAFIHKTFQEYLCAQEILYRQTNQNPTDENYVPHVRNHIQQYLNQPHWREVLLLLVAQQKPDPTQALLKMILSTESDYEAWLHRDLLFAGSCLAESPNISDEATARQILDSLVELEVSVVPETAETLRAEVFKVISSHHDTPFADHLMQRLSEHSSDLDRWRLIDYQVELAPDAAAFVLLNLLKNDDYHVRERAAKSLNKLRHDSDAVTAGLLDLLKVGGAVPYFVIISLGRLEQSSDAVITGLLDLLKNGDPIKRNHAMSALVQLEWGADVVVASLLDLLKDKARGARYHAAEYLVQLGQSSDVVVASLLDLLKNDSAEIRDRAIVVLGQLGQGSDAVIAALLDLLKDKDRHVRSRAAESLGKIGQDSDAVVSGLFELLKDKACKLRTDLYVRYRAAASLVQLGHCLDIGIAVLLDELKADSAWARSRIAEWLVQLGQGSDVVVDVLLGLFRDSDREVRSRATESLRELGQSSDAVVTGLLALLKDEDRGVRSRAAALLVQLGQDSDVVVVACLLDLLKDDDYRMRSLAIESLKGLEQGSDTVIAGLLILLKDDRCKIRYRVLVLLKQLGQGSEAVIAVLLDLLKDNKSEVRSCAAAALGQMGNGSEMVVNGLLTLLKDNEVGVRSCAATALGQLGQRTDVVVASLLDLLKDSSPLAWPKKSVNQEAAKSLVTLSKQSDGVKPALVNWVQQHQQDDFIGVGLDALSEMVS